METLPSKGEGEMIEAESEHIFAAGKVVTLEVLKNLGSSGRFERFKRLERFEPHSSQ